MTFMIVGLARHICIALWDIRRAMRSAGDSTISYTQVAVATLRWVLPFRRITERLLFSITSLLFHISTIIVPLFLAGHITLWQRGLGISWPALPNTWATALTVAAVTTGIALVVQRLTSRDSRAVSRSQDYLLPLIVALPFASGLLVMHPTLNPLSYDLALLMHVLSADALLFLIPLTKLSHMALLPGTQFISELAWHFPRDSGSRVAAALGKVNDPI